MLTWFRPGKHTIIIYCKIFPHNNFVESAQCLFEATHKAQDVYPNKKRLLYLEIDGHRILGNEFDLDMILLQKDFLPGSLIRFVTEIHGPLIDVINGKPQQNDIPSVLSFDDSECPKQLN
jgi:hypothetical protein